MLLLDLEMPGPSPIEVVAHLRQHSPAMKIIALTNGESEAAICNLVVARVAGYLLETEPPKVVVQAIRSLAHGGTWFSRPIIEQLVQKSSRPKTSDLTEEELAVLQLVVAGQTDDQISRKLGVSERTIRYRLQNICNKLGVNTRIEAAVQAVRVGLA